MRQTGKIARFFGDRGFGFVSSPETGEEYFFHISQFTDPPGEIARGVRVSFELGQDRGRVRAEKLAVETSRPRAKRQIGPYVGPTLELDDEARRQALTEISRWKLEARLDDMKRYFFTVPELQNITTGEASYVIGRKGTGKTALVQYLSEQVDPNLLVTKLTFKNFPFNELYEQANERYTRPNQYITIWKLIIYSAACRLIANSRKTDPLLKQAIDKAFPPTESDNLGTIVGKWIAGDFGVSVLGTGVNIANWFKEKKPIPIQAKVENLEAFVKKHMPSHKIMILFDELDEDYKDVFENFGRSEYLDLLTSLFKAVQDVRSVMEPAGKCLYPVIFLRNDIYDLIQDADKNKWRDLEIDLNWTDEGIQALIAHRLAKVFGTSGEDDFDALWYSIFTPEALIYSKGKKEIASFQYMKMSAQGRPRDYINYLKECASIELKRSAREISVETIKDADKAYSNYLKNELIDEIHGLIPDIPKVLSIFSQLRKSILTVDEFIEAYDEQVEAGTVTVEDAVFVLKTLFYFSVIGNVVRVGIHIFRHERPDAQLNFKENIVVHRGLVKALQIL